MVRSIPRSEGRQRARVCAHWRAQRFVKFRCPAIPTEKDSLLHDEQVDSYALWRAVRAQIICAVVVEGLAATAAPRRVVVTAADQDVRVVVDMKHCATIERRGINGLLPAGGRVG